MATFRNRSDEALVVVTGLTTPTSVEPDETIEVPDTPCACVFGEPVTDKDGNVTIVDRGPHAVSDHMDLNERFVRVDAPKPAKVDE